ncbi:chain length-determining protein [Congregibacter variabilis]|uniref:Chain length-determining protein n=1 Tax=Congregibacter variabilis TaxID=3081200 RepID=A0ABZ0I8J2_9GAMM|nr:chain length-determining protein [Congregibacter sp. IMCC43200]
MQDTIALIIGHIWGVWRWRWLAILVAWLVAIGGWTQVWRMPESYVATASVYVDTNSILRPLLRGLTISPNINQRVSMISQQLLSRPNLEELGRRSDLDLNVTTEGQRAAMVGRLERAINIRATQRASVYNISVKDPDRDVAKRVTQELITVFIENMADEDRADNSGAQEFLDEQITEYEARLVEAENRLAIFKQQNVAVLPGTGGDYFARLQSAGEDLRAAQLELDEERNRAEQLRRQLSGDDPLADLGAISTPLDARITALRTRLDELLMRYTDLHPEVRQIRGLIDELRHQQEETVKTLREQGDIDSSLSGSPVYQGIRSLLAETEAQVAELEVRVREYQARVSSLDEQVMLIPEKEAQLKQLDRDYEVLQRRYAELIQRRESARLSLNVENDASDVSFRIVEPPFVPLKPSEPDKFVLNAAVLIGALAAGLGVAFLASLLQPMVSDPRTLSMSTGLPVLGVVTQNKQPGERRRDNWRLAIFGGCAACLLMTFVTVLMGAQWLS